MSNVMPIRLFRKRLGEISTGWGLALEICHFHEHASLHIWPIYLNICITLPQWMHRPVPMGEIMTGYGFSWRGGKYDCWRDIHLNWGSKTKIIHMPWDYAFIRHDVLMANGTWKRVAKGRLNDTNDNARPWAWTDKFQETHDYTYTLKNGTVQQRKAIIGVEEREWRQKWLKWCPWFALVRRVIDVTFDGEVGERSGSWKGGTIGCSYELLADETPLQCLRRMEKERKF